MDKYQYDGIDIDYEPGYGASGPFVGHDNALFTKLINAMSKYVGPKSGTGRLLIIDGVPYAVDRSVVDCFDYGIVQAYASSGYTDLQNRFNNADAKGWKPEQYIFAENFESYWKTGGVDFTDREGNRMPSLYGMATFNPTQGAAPDSVHTIWSTNTVIRPCRTNLCAMRFRWPILPEAGKRLSMWLFE